VVHSIDVINLVRPDLVVITGDITTGPPATEEDAKNFADLIVHNLQAPIFYTPGNHDARFNVMDWRLGWPANSYIGYYAFMNPYPDYAFDLGPVNFISLDHKWEVVGGNFRSSFTPEQLDFLGHEVSSSNRNLTTIMFHDHWRGFDLDGYDYDLILAGHNHNNLAYRMPGGSLLLVTGAPDRTDDMIRIVEYGQDGILSCSYNPYDLASATPTKLVDIDVCPAEGCGCYQRLEVRNNLDTGLYNSSWIFNLTGKGPGWGSLVIGGELDSAFRASTRTYYRVGLDLPPHSGRTVECFNLIPENRQSAMALESLLRENMVFTASLQRYLDEDSGPEWRRLGEVVSGRLEEANQYLSRAKETLDGGNWTGGGILYSRALHILEPIRNITECMYEAETLLQKHREVGMNTSLLETWILDALDLLETRGFYPSLMEIRREDPTPIGQILRIVELGENNWQLADQIGLVGQNIDRATGEGRVLESARNELNQVKQWFDLGYYSLSAKTLNQMRGKYPELFVNEFRIALLFLFLLPILGARDYLLGDTGNNPSIDTEAREKSRYAIKSS